jgi:DNA repair protein RecO (recombination protein O)
MNIIKTHGIVLKRTNFGEADRIVQILTPEYGKISMMAKGVRKEKSKLAQAIELFSISEFVIRKGKREIYILTSARLDTFYHHILETYSRLEFGYEIVRKISRLSEHIHESQLYDILATTLMSIDTIAIDERITRAWTYLQLADIQGHGLNLSRDVDNQSLHIESRYRFDIAEMSFIKDINGPFQAEHLKLLKILKLKTPDIIAHVSGIEDYLDSCLSLAHATAE